MPDLLIIFGASGHGKVVAEAALAAAPGRKIIFLDDAEECHGSSILGIAVSGGRSQLGALRGTPVALGIGDNRARWKVLSWLRTQGHALETVIHPAAILGQSVEIGEGTFLGAGAIAIAEARIGAGAIVNTGATVDHDCEIGKAAHIGPGVHLCGNVRVGARALLGVGSVVKPGISIADDVIIGAGSVVVRDVASGGTYVGNPARALIAK